MNRVPLLFAPGSFAMSAKDLSALLLIDVEAGICEKTSRVEEAVTTVQSFVERARLSQEPTFVVTQRLRRRGQAFCDIPHLAGLPPPNVVQGELRRVDGALKGQSRPKRSVSWNPSCGESHSPRRNPVAWSTGRAVHGRRILR